MNPVTNRLPDAACGLYQGQRKSQQDAVKTITDATTGITILALSDGMGGAGYGNLASRMILQTAIANLSNHYGNMAQNPASTPDYLMNAATAANRRLADFIQANPDKAGLGGTLVLLVLIEAKVYWLSIGDSLAYRLNSGKLERINEDHSLATGLDNLAKLGKLDPKIAKNMAARNSLTSALMGEKLKKVDCPKEGLSIRANDTFLIATDGIQTIEEDELQRFWGTRKFPSAAHCVAETLSKVEELNASGQDNLGVCAAVIL